LADVTSTCRQAIIDATRCENTFEANKMFGNAILDEIEEFLTGARLGAEPDRALLTVLFTDIVSSTERAAALGDRRWRDLLDSHRMVMRHELARHRGREVATTGDGFLATFDGPARAIRCAVGAREVVRQLGLEIRPACTPANANSLAKT
jgi:class 3 adenylate cyclase